MEKFLHIFQANVSFVISGIAFGLAILVMFWMLFWDVSPRAFLKKSWLFVFTYQKKLEPAAEGESDDSPVKLDRFQQTWSVSNFKRMIVIIMSTGVVGSLLNDRLNGWSPMGYIAFGLQICVLLIASALVHAMYDFFSPCLAYTSESSWSDVFWFSHDGKLKKFETCMVFVGLLATAILTPFVSHYTDESLKIFAVCLVLYIGYSLIKEHRGNKIKSEGDAIRLAAERKVTANNLAVAEEAIRTSNEVLAAGEIITAEMQEQIRSSTELLASNAEKEAKRVAKKAEEDAKKLAGYQALVDERDFLLTERNRLIEKVDALFAERKKFALRDARDLVRAKVLIEASKAEVVSPKLMEARSLIIGVLYQSPLEQTEKDSIELGVCRDLGHVPVKK